MKKQMARSGFSWQRSDVLLGLHDFEQYYTDIFRKVFTHTRKFARHMPAAERMWRSRAREDADFAIALWTLCLSRQISDWKGDDDVPQVGNVRIDKRMFPSNIDALLVPAGLVEKPPFSADEGTQAWVDRKLAMFQDATEFRAGPAPG